jgi:hypothetical protein
MRRFFRRSLVKGIGPVDDGRIIDMFGEATLVVIDDSQQYSTSVHHAALTPVR